MRVLGCSGLWQGLPVANKPEKWVANKSSFVLKGYMWGGGNGPTHLGVVVN